MEMLGLPLEERKKAYAGVDLSSLITKYNQAEKQVISKYSLNGIHWWKRGEDFAKSVHHMVEVNSTVNGEYYVGPSYNYLNGIKRVYNIDPSEHFAVGTLEDIERYRKLYGR